MASRPELIGFMKELKLEYEHKSIDEMVQEVKDVCDARFDRDFLVPYDVVSDELRKFLTVEYDYMVRGKQRATILNYKGEKV